ncbi:MAG: hypothetical protein Q9226_000667 [Calogaya cf. arnoldii]
MAGRYRIGERRRPENNGGGPVIVHCIGGSIMDLQRPRLDVEEELQPGPWHQILFRAMGAPFRCVNSPGGCVDGPCEAKKCRKLRELAWRLGHERRWDPYHVERFLRRDEIRHDFVTRLSLDTYIQSLYEVILPGSPAVTLREELGRGTLGGQGQTNADTRPRDGGSGGGRARQGNDGSGGGHGQTLGDPYESGQGGNGGGYSQTLGDPYGYGQGGSGGEYSQTLGDFYGYGQGGSGGGNGQTYTVIRPRDGGSGGEHGRTQGGARQGNDGSGGRHGRTQGNARPGKGDIGVVGKGKKKSLWIKK